jgi:proteasome lid subunit RPN8/RPN11
MKLLLPPPLVKRLAIALEKAGTHEIGGILMGKHVTENVFQVTDLTIQRHGGGFATFLRVVQDITEPLRNFFRATNHNYTRFNYLGEWHSHPSFIPEPSSRDHQTMRDIIEDPDVGANFVVLMIVKLNQSRQLEGSVTVYQPNEREFMGELVQEKK